MLVLYRDSMACLTMLFMSFQHGKSWLNFSRTTISCLILPVNVLQGHICVTNGCHIMYSTYVLRAAPPDGMHMLACNNNRYLLD